MYIARDIDILPQFTLSHCYTYITLIKKLEFNITTSKLHTFKSTHKKQLLIDITGYINSAVKQGVKKLRY